MKVISEKLISKNDVFGSFLRVTILAGLVVLAGYWFVQEANASEFEGYPRTPGDATECQHHGGFVFQTLYLRYQGKTEEEVLDLDVKEREKQEAQHGMRDSSYRELAKYLIKEAFKAPEAAFASPGNAREYATDYMNECIRQKAEETES